MEISTREKILWEALKLFAKNGYEGVSMREIAAAVGIKGASIYSHFKGKEDIFHAIFDEMEARYHTAAREMTIPDGAAPEDMNSYRSISEQKLFEMTENLFSFFTQNEYALLFRRMLVSEQNRSELAANYYLAYYLDAPFKYQSSVFRELQKLGEFSGYDADIMALHFYSPVFYIINRFDRGEEYEECLRKVKEHIHYFCSLYKSD